MIDLNVCAAAALRNAQLRQENGANIDCDTYHMLKHTATEVLEALDAYNRYDSDRKMRPGYVSDEEIVEDREHFASELADVICCILIIAANNRIDVEEAIHGCLEKNKKRAEGTGDKK